MIKNIILDFGGVLLNVDYALTFKKFKELGAEGTEEMLSHYHEYDLFDRFEEGKINAAQFRTEMKKILKLEKLKDELFDEAWNAMLLDVPEERLFLVDELKRQGYFIILFSNTNDIHFESLFSKMDLIDFHRHFHKAYYSNQIHYRKPNKKGFEIIIKENNLIPQETLFVDDTKQHILSAKSLGMKTHHVKPKTFLRDIIPAIIRVDGEYF